MVGDIIFLFGYVSIQSRCKIEPKKFDVKRLAFFAFLPRERTTNLNLFMII